MITLYTQNKTPLQKGRLLKQLEKPLGFSFALGDRITNKAYIVVEECLKRGYTPETEFCPKFKFDDEISEELQNRYSKGFKVDANNPKESVNNEIKNIKSVGVTEYILSKDNQKFTINKTLYDYALYVTTQK